jgi:hypothetical protein
LSNSETINEGNKNPIAVPIGFEIEPIVVAIVL